jgi:hypothetical protein
MLGSQESLYDINFRLILEQYHDLPEGFNENEIHIFKGYFCKFMCQSNWDNFYEEQVFLNDALKEHARASYNNETEKVYMKESLTQTPNINS